jgi:uncharacterized protein YbjT (DUF2867 family)
MSEPATKTPHPARRTVVIAGASGFVGSALREALDPTFRVVGISRRGAGPGRADAWRQADLYDLGACEAALEGCDVAVYLVHSMMPSARLTQGGFEDLDLLLADNFARAAKKNGVQQIVYLGGLVPQETRAGLSPHLASRLEVEEVLGQHGVPVTALRAGIVVGPGGSSLEIMTNLVRRLPVVPCPPWTEAQSWPVSLRDAVRALCKVIGDADARGEVYDIAGPERLRYRDMFSQTAEVLGLKRPLLPFPAVDPTLMAIAATVLSGMPYSLVAPLVRSLGHDMAARDNALLRWLHEDGDTFVAALRASLDADGALKKRSRVAGAAAERTRLRAERVVRSLQRLPLPAGRSAQWVAKEYARWLPTAPLPGLTVREEDGLLHLGLAGLDAPLLSLHLLPEEATGPGMAAYEITGGLLVRAGGDRAGRFEFREVLEGEHVLTSVQDFRPNLPIVVYRFTQALVHLWLVTTFGWHLGGLAVQTPREAGSGFADFVRRQRAA